MRNVFTSIGPYLVIILLPIFVFWQGLFTNSIIVLGDFTGSDLLDLHLPYKYALRDSYMHGAVPLWSRYLGTGYPLLAEGQSGPLYPPNILLSFIEPFLALNISIVLAFIVAGSGAYTYARSLKLGRAVSLWIGIAFMFSSFFVARQKHLNMIVVAGYLPWSIWALKKGIVHTFSSDGLLKTHIRFNWFILLGIFWSLQLFAGHPHMAYLCILMILWQVFCEIVYLIIHLKKKSLRPVTFICLGVMFAAILLLCIASAQLLPTAELTLLSGRTRLTFERVVGNPMRGKFLLTLFYPYIFGNPADGTYRVDILTQGVWWENVLYIGVIPIVLSILFLSSKIKPYFLEIWKSSDRVSYLFELVKKLSYSTYYLASLLVGSLLFLSLSFGGYSFTYLLAFYLVPGMSLFRFPTRFNLYLLLVLCVFSGWGLLQLWRMVPYRPMIKNSIFFILFIFTIFDLAYFNARYITYIPAERYLAKPQAISSFDSKELFRIYPFTQYEINPYLLLGWKKGMNAIVSNEQAIPGDTALMYHVDSFSDRGWFEGGLVSRTRYDLENYLVADDALQVDTWARLLGAWNVRYLLAYSHLSNYTVHAEYPADTFFGTTLKVYENPNVLPRAFFSSTVTYISRTQDLIERMKSSTWNPRKEVFSQNEQQQSDLGLPELRYDAVQITRYENEFVEMKVDPKQKGVLVFSDLYYPGWHAFIDGKETKIFPVNMIQRGVEVPAGFHVITWEYRPIFFYIGLAISSVSVILITIWLLIWCYLYKGYCYEAIA